jgi:hypothetical protein
MVAIGIALAGIGALALVILLVLGAGSESAPGTRRVSVTSPSATAARQPTAGRPTAGPGSGGQGQFVATDGRQFIYQGRPVKLYGYTFYPAPVGGTAAWHRTTFPQYIDHVLDLGALAGQNMARPTDFWDKTNTQQTWNDPTLWANLDYLVRISQQRHVFVLMDLSAFRWLLVSKGQDPYNASNWTTYLDFVGARYRSATSIAFYSIVGEPPAPTTPAATAQLVAFYRAVTDELRKADGGRHLIAAGGFNHMEDETPQTPWWHEIYALPSNDVVAFKTYSQHDLNLMPTITAYAQQLAKPMVDEEFGMPQSMGDATYAGGSTGYNGLYTSRAQFFQTVYQLGEGHSVTSFVFWNLGCQIGTGSFEVSPNTPAVWQVITSHGPATPIPWSAAASPC